MGALSRGDSERSYWGVSRGLLGKAGGVERRFGDRGCIVRSSLDETQHSSQRLGTTLPHGSRSHPRQRSRSGVFETCYISPRECPPNRCFGLFSYANLPERIGRFLRLRNPTAGRL